MSKQSLPTIPAGEYPKRWKKVRAMMSEKKLDALLAYADDHIVYGPAHARWLANFTVHFEPVCILFVGDAPPVLLCGPESDEYARLTGKISRVVILEEFSHPDEDYAHTEIKGLAEIAGELGGKKSVRRIGIAGKSLMPENVLHSFQKAFRGAVWEDVESEMCQLRAVKTPAEIKVIEYAYEISELGILAAISAIKPGVTEREIAAAAEYAMRSAGSEGMGIDTIVASGENTRPILARTSFRKIAKNDLVLLTIAPRYEGYHGAIGRPVLVGKPGAKIEEAVKIAAQAQVACGKALKAGTDGGAVEAIGRAILKKANLEKYFLYSGIHSVGVIEFEPPIFGPSKSGKIKSGMVLSIDIPMFNAPWGGLRIEDGYLIGSKTRCLCDIPHLIYK